eukprot:980827_1
MSFLKSKTIHCKTETCPQCIQEMKELQCQIHEIQCQSHNIKHRVDDINRYQINHIMGYDQTHDIEEYGPFVFEDTNRYTDDASYTSAKRKWIAIEEVKMKHMNEGLGDMAKILIAIDTDNDEKAEQEQIVSNMKRLSLSQLKKRCGKEKVSAEGNKSDMIARIVSKLPVESNIETKTLYIEYDASIETLKLLIEIKFNIPAECQRLIFKGDELQNEWLVFNVDINDESDTIHLETKEYEPLKGVWKYVPFVIPEDIERGIAEIEHDFDKIIIGGSTTMPIHIHSFHVSCQSDQITGDNMAGVVLYSYDGEQDWYLNGVHCKSGYIVLKLSDSIKDIPSSHGMVHGSCYKSVFGQEIDDKVVGAGFAFFNNKWKFNSYTFNVATSYHDNRAAMHPLEQKFILAAIGNWK